MPSEYLYSNAGPVVGFDPVDNLPSLDLKMEYDFPQEENLLEEFGSVFDNLLDGPNTDDKMCFDSALFDNLLEDDSGSSGGSPVWHPMFPQLADLHSSPSAANAFNVGFRSEFDLKTESESPVSSPQSFSSSSDSCSSSDVTKFGVPTVLDTPPISPPRNGDLSPPPQPLVTVQKTSDKKSAAVLKIDPKNIKIISCSASAIKGLKPIGKHAKVVLPKEILEKVEKIKKERELSSSSPAQLTVQQNSDIKLPTLQRNVVVTLSNGAVAPVSQLKKESQLQGCQPLLATVLRPAQSVVPGTKSINALKLNGTTSRREDLAMKALKKQQRMIKNRESACLSRKKKKEYVTNLESKINELEKENRCLRLENDSLKSRLKELECNSTSDWSSGYGKFATGGFGGRGGGVLTNFKKTTALLAVIFMVSINFGSLSLMHRENEPGRGVKSSEEGRLLGGGAGYLGSAPPVRLGRTLLWAQQESTAANTSSAEPPAMCPLYVNQTESLRLEKELRRWIAVDSRSGASGNATVSKLHNSNKAGYESATAFGRPTLRQLILHSPFGQNNNRHWKAQHRLSRALDSGALEVVYGAAGLFPGSMPRRDDTFYVVSFSDDHLLVPALAHNMSLRPRMSLILPTVPVNGSNVPKGAIAMMQIDCEVLATRSLHLTGSDITSLREMNRRQNNTQSHDHSVDMKDSRPPYFVRTSKSPGDTGGGSVRDDGRAEEGGGRVRNGSDGRVTPEFDSTFDPYREGRRRTYAFP
ncbi:hypothetical protein AAG570_011460 [Ranatra chinensis]|uniref:BZIP domain-containing protein n=1 Tax=Ranatra chinensis TaxID=642074 RepID=A0ABD0Z906_9HEMI